MSRNILYCIQSTTVTRQETDIAARSSRNFPYRNQPWSSYSLGLAFLCFFSIYGSESNCSSWSQWISSTSFPFFLWVYRSTSRGCNLCMVSRRLWDGRSSSPYFEREEWKESIREVLIKCFSPISLIVSSIPQSTI